MSVQVEKLEHNMAKLTIEVPAEELEKAIDKAYVKVKNSVAVPGFRKGKVPKNIIEKMYGKEVFYEDAANILIPDAYEKAYDECEEEIVSRPQIEIVQVESGKPFIFTAEVALRPDCELGKYFGVEVEKIDAEVSEDEINADIEKERENSASVEILEDEAIAEKDTAYIDFKGFVDGEAFEGGEGTNYALTIGSHSFIDTFEDQLIGKKTGDEVDVNVTFPEDYQAENLKGKAAKFEVKINKVERKHLPELDDEFASEVSEYETFEEYKDSVKKKILERKENEIKSAKEDAVIDKIIEDAKMDIPDIYIETMAGQVVNEFAQQLSMQGLSMDQYYKFTASNEQMMIEQAKPQALKRIQTRLVLEEIVKKENIEVTGEELDEEYKKLAEGYRMDVDKVKEIFGTDEREEDFKKDIAVQKAITLVTEKAVEK